MKAASNVSRIVNPADLIGSATVCRLLEINRSTLTRWVKSGKLGCLIQLDGPQGAYVFDRADIDALAASK